MRKLYTFSDVEQEFKRINRRLSSLSGSSGTPGIDDVLAQEQALSSPKTINLDERTLSFVSANDFLFSLVGGGDSTLVFDSSTGERIRAGNDANGIQLVANDGVNACDMSMNRTTSISLYRALSHQFNGRILGQQGAGVTIDNVGSYITLGMDGNTFEVLVDSNDELEKIESAGWTLGSKICLFFTENGTVVHNASDEDTKLGIILALGNTLVVTAGDMLFLILASVNGVPKWREIYQSV